MFWLEVLGVEFRCAFDRIPQWQSHLDGIDIALIRMIITMEYNSQLSIVIRIVIAMKVNIDWSIPLPVCLSKVGGCCCHLVRPCRGLHKLDVTTKLSQ